jgi:uncharacterized protein (TIGR02145 family)
MSITDKAKLHTQKLGERTMKAIKLATIIFLVFISFGYSQETGTVTDVDGNTYKTVKIGDQWWMAENLKVTHYRNGDVIPNITNNITWTNLSTGACCGYNNNADSVSIYGRLYNWYAVSDTRNIAPEGWHVPSENEWKQLEMYLGMSQSDADKSGARGTNEGGKLKETGTAHWHSPNTGATNESGFSALAGGGRVGWTMIFMDMGIKASFWCSKYDIYFAWFRYMNYKSSKVIRDITPVQEGLSVRCLKDQDTSGIESKSKTPKIFELSQNYPNPFNSETVISYTLPTNCYVKLTIYNIKGEIGRASCRERVSLHV